MNLKEIEARIQSVCPVRQHILPAEQRAPQPKLGRLVPCVICGTEKYQRPGALAKGEGKTSTVCT